MIETERNPSFLRSLAAVIRGEQRDYTRGSLGRAIALLAIPMVLEMSMQAVFEVVDVYFVGRLGSDAIAAVGLTSGIVTLVYAVCVGLAMAVTAMVARRIGEGKPAAASTAAVQAIILTAGATIPIALAGIFYADTFLVLMGASPSVVEIGSGFCTVMLGTNAVIMFLFVFNAIFRGAGDAGIAMWMLTLANLLNIALDPIFIFGWGPVPAMGVTGAAVATSIGRGTAVLVQLILLVRGSGKVRLGLANLGIDRAVLGRLLRVASTGVLQFLVATASWLALIRIAALFGSVPLAGYTIAIRLIIFALLPSWGLGMAAATLVGQNLGGGKPDRAERAAWISSFSSMVLLGLLGLFFFLLARPMLGIFSTDAEVVTVGVSCLRIVCPSYLFLAFGMVLVQAFNGAGDTWTPTWINLICYWLIQIPLAWVLSMQAGLGIEGVFAAIASTQVVLAAIAIAVFRRGSWKTQMI